MERLAQIKKLSEKDKVWDIVVVGGGATGLGVAVDAATRGMSVALLEKTDFAKCTSSRSTKLVHGGVRYLQKGDVMLVLEALRERGRMKANAPHLVKDQAFVISNYRYWDNFLYFCGLTFYDMLSFGFGYGRSKYISAKKVMKYIPTSVEKGLKGGVVYHDGQFDDSRMAVNLAQTCVENGGTVVNQATVTGIVHDAAGRAAGIMKERAQLITDLWDLISYFFVAPAEYEEKQTRKYWKGQNPAILAELRGVLAGIDDFSKENTERIVHGWIDEKGYGMGQVMNTLRLALVGAGKGPGMYDVTEFIGREECLRRIDRLLKNLKPAE